MAFFFLIQKHILLFGFFETWKLQAARKRNSYLYCCSQLLRISDTWNIISYSLFCCQPEMKSSVLQLYRLLAFSNRTFMSQSLQCFQGHGQGDIFLSHIHVQYLWISMISTAVLLLHPLVLQEILTNRCQKLKCDFS